MWIRYGIRITGIARYASTLYAFWISVRSPNCAIPKSTTQQINAATISFVPILLFLPVSVSFFTLLRPLQILFTIAATILTAVDTAPRMIKTEISGIINPFPTPHCTCDDIRNIHDQKTCDNADKQDRSHPTHQVCSKYCHNEDKYADNQRTQQIRKSGQGT